MNPELRQSLAHGSYDAIVAHVTAALGVPVALLERQGETWCVRAHAQPSDSGPDVGPEMVPLTRGADGSVTPEMLSPWTALAIDAGQPASTLLILPGPAERWQTPAMRELMSDLAVAVELITMREAAAAAKRAFGRAQALTEELSKLHDGDPPDALALALMAAAVDVEVGALGVIPIGERHLMLKATLGYPAVLVADLRIAPGEGILGQVMATGASLLVPDASRQYSQRARRRRYRSDSFLAVPLKISGETIGVVCVTDRRDGHALDANDLETLRELTPAVSLAVSRARLHEYVGQLQDLATQDSLTGLGNRRYFCERMDVEIPRARRQRSPLAVVIIDADGFKAINDRFGHAAGDGVLKNVAEVLRRAVRVFDVCARLGGDEFAVLMPGSDASAAVHTADRIRRQLSALTFPPGASSPPLKLTVSIGIGVLQPHAGAEDLLVEADRALYEAKAAGGDHIRVWSHPTAAASA